MVDQTDFEWLDERAGNGFLSNVYHLEKIASGMRWAEGPVWFADHRRLLWSDVPSNRMYAWTEGGYVTAFRDPSNFAKGNTCDRQGRLVTCEHSNTSGDACRALRRTTWWSRAIARSSSPIQIMPMICSSVKRLRFILWSFDRPELTSKWIS